MTNPITIFTTARPDKHLRIFGFTFFTLFSSSPLLAATVATPDTTVHGFGSLSATQTDDTDFIYRQFDQASSEKLSLLTDSVLGLQVDFSHNDKFSSTFQFIARDNYQGSVDVSPEWGFVSYQANNHFNIKLGRVLSPIFFESEYRYVGYSRVAVRPAQTLYPFYPLSSHDGLSIRFSDFRLAGGIVNIESYAGATRYHLPDSVTGDSRFYKGRLLYGGVFNWELKPVTLQLGYHSLDFNIEGDGFTMPFTSIANALSTCYDTLGNADCGKYARFYEHLLNKTSVEIWDAAIKAESGPLTLTGEIFWRQSNAAFPDLRGYSISGSWLVNEWTPYLNYGGVNTTSLSSPEPGLDNLPAPYTATGQLVNTLITRGQIDRNTLALGVRWDFAPKMDVKFEAMQVKLDNAASRPDIYTALDFPFTAVRDDNFILYTLCFDFIY